MNITLEIIDSFIEREQMHIDNAFVERDVDKHKWHRAKQRAFEEIKEHIEKG